LHGRAKKNGVRVPIDIIPNGVDIQKFSKSPDENRNSDLKRELKIKDEKIVITTSRLVEKNGLEYLVRAMAGIESAKLLILGSGELEEKLKKIAQELDLGSKISFLGDIKNEKIPDYLSISDIFVRPSLSEGQGISFLEAMAAGVPVVATPVGGITDFLIDGETGLFCQPKDPESIARKINILLSDNELWKKLSENGKNLVRQKYDWDDISQKMKSALV
jgi:glycosyltransferase involved in cell wall biosynthesis